METLRNLIIWIVINLPKVIGWQKTTLSDSKEVEIATKNEKLWKPWLLRFRRVTQFKIRHIECTIVSYIHQCITVHRCSQVRFMIFSASFRSTVFLLLQVCSLYLRKLSRIHCHIRGSMLHNISLIFSFVFNGIFLFLNIWIRFWKAYFPISMPPRISVRIFPLPKVSCQTEY